MTFLDTRVSAPPVSINSEPSQMKQLEEKLYLEVKEHLKNPTESSVVCAFDILDSMKTINEEKISEIAESASPVGRAELLCRGEYTEAVIKGIINADSSDVDHATLEQKLTSSSDIDKITNAIQEMMKPIERNLCELAVNDLKGELRFAIRNYNVVKESHELMVRSLEKHQPLAEYNRIIVEQNLRSYNQLRNELYKIHDPRIRNGITTAMNELHSTIEAELYTPEINEERRKLREAIESTEKTVQEQTHNINYFEIAVKCASTNWRISGKQYAEEKNLRKLGILLADLLIITYRKKTSQEHLTKSELVSTGMFV